MSVQSVSGSPRTFSTTTTDSVMAGAVEETVRERTAGRVRELQVELSETAIVLTGYAADYYTKQLATHAALDAVSLHSSERGWTARTLENSIQVD